nr:heme ABC transporter ATP-binding protein [Jiangella endophytica]
MTNTTSPHDQPRRPHSAGPGPLATRDDQPPASTPTHRHPEPHARHEGQLATDPADQPAPTDHPEDQHTRRPPEPGLGEDQPSIGRRRRWAAVRRGHRLPAPPVAGSVVTAATAVSVALGGTRVLEDVSIEVRAGEVLALVGPNGAGKSTLLSALTGDVAVSAGTVTLAGAPLSAWSATESAMRRAVLLQQVRLSFPFTVAEVVEMGRAPWAGTPLESTDDDAVRAALADADVAQFAARRFTSLSGGEQARVALARVLAQRTGLLLLDEPTAALDLRHQELVLSVARSRAATGVAVVVVLHDLNLAAAHADRVAVLAGGRIVATGAPADVLGGDLLTEVYDHDVEVIAHPRTGTPVILPRR